METDNPATDYAFPLAYEGRYGGKQYVRGMTLLDYFAAQALKAMIPIDYSDKEDPISIDQTCSFAYEYAIEMMEEREKRGIK